MEGSSFHFDTNIYGSSISADDNMKESWVKTDTRMKESSFNADSSIPKGIMSQFKFLTCMKVHEMINQHGGMIIQCWHQHEQKFNQYWHQYGRKFNHYWHQYELYPILLVIPNCQESQFSSNTNIEWIVV